MKRWSTFGMTCLAVLAVGASTPASAQEALGRVFNPAMPPLMPNVVAFERIQGEARTIHFLDVSSGRVFPLEASVEEVDPDALVLPGMIAGSRITGFSGDLDWRPVWDGPRRWFAYVAGTGEGSVGLFLHYLDGRDAVGDTEPILIPTSGSVRTPRWSPDGRMLTYSSDGAFYVIPRADRLLEPGQQVRGTVPTERFTPRGDALYPTFSPAGNRIAYSVETTVGGRNWGIEVVDITTEGTPAGAPVLLTPTLADANELRPSWSPDGASIAYYLDRAAQGGRQIDIGVVQVFENDDGLVTRGQVRQGRSPRIADDVFPNEVRGPAWTLWNAGSGRVAPAIVYVSDDASQDFPVMLASVDAWASGQPEYAVRLDDAEAWGTRQHKFVAVAPHRLDRTFQTRFAYVHQVGGSEGVEVRDISNPALRSVQSGCRAGRAGCWIALTERPFVNGAGSRSKSLSLLIPGAGQWRAGEKLKGGALLAVAAGAGVFALVNRPTIDESAVEKIPGTNYYLPDDPEVQQWKDKRSNLYVAAGVFGVAWAIAALDAFVLGGETPMSLEVSPSPSVGVHTPPRWDLAFRIRR